MNGIGTAWRIYTLQIGHGHLSVVQVYILFLNFSSAFLFLELSGTKSHIFSASEEKLSLPKFTVFVFICFSVDLLKQI